MDIAERSRGGQSPLVLPATDHDVRFVDQVPFPHAVFDDVLADSPRVVGDFPPPDWSGWLRYPDSYQRGKLICSQIDAMPVALQDLVCALNGPDFLSWLENLAGIGELIPDPYLEGGGLHCTGPGGTLTPHTDFHLYSRLNLYRRLNAILYLNPGWEPGDGGELELFARGSEIPAVRIEPILGRLVVFQTDHQSVHGFTAPVREGTVRRSVATYYYTATEADRFSGDTNTYWRSHDSGGGVHRARMGAYRGLLFGSRALSWLAHRANPNLGRNVRAR